MITYYVQGFQQIIVVFLHILLMFNIIVPLFHANYFFKNCTSTQIHLKCILIPFFPGKMTRKCVRIYFITFSSHNQWLSTCPFFNKNFSQVTIYYLNISSIYVYLTYLSYLLQKKCERQLVLCLHYYSFYYRYIPTTHLIIFAAILIWTTQFKCFLFIESWDNETSLSITTKMVHGNI